MPRDQIIVQIAARNDWFTAGEFDTRDKAMAFIVWNREIDARPPVWSFRYRIRGDETGLFE